MMTFDYYDNAAHEMATDTQTSATGLVEPARRAVPGQAAGAAVGRWSGSPR